MDEFDEIEKKYLQEKEVHMTKQVISTYICPICGARLKGSIGGATGDCLEFKAYIDCNSCNLFHAQSGWHSNYDRGNYRNEALVDVMLKVTPYIKNFGSPLENV